MARRRFFVDRIREGKAELVGEEARHLARVLRAETASRCEVSDNRSAYLAEITQVRRGRVEFAILEELAPRPEPVHLWLLVSLVKFDRFEWILEKGTELGVERFVPVNAARSEKGLEAGAVKRLERWRRIVREASQQARRDRLPEIVAPIGWERALATPASRGFFLDEDEGARPIAEHIPEPDGRLATDTVALLTGPEGGWTDPEREQAAAAGWTPVTLGPRILRTETAAIAAGAFVSIAWQSRTRLTRSRD